MKVFVSYSRRGGEVTERTLRLVEKYLSGITTPFIHCFQPKRRFEQVSVVVALARSNLVVLVDSPAARKSPWVRLELGIARFLLRPVLRISAADLTFRSETEL